MRTKTIFMDLYEYEELSEEAQDKAINHLSEIYWQQVDIYDYITDNCCLLDIPEVGKKGMGIKDLDSILFKNNRKSIFWNDYFFDCSRAIEITDYDAFYKWLELTKPIINKLNNSEISLEISNKFEGNTYLKLIVENEETVITQKQSDVLDKAMAKFNNHIKQIGKNVREECDYLLSKEYFINNEVVNEYEYLKNGTPQIKE